jgi:hypothetical protein
MASVFLLPALHAVLSQGASLIESLDDDAYTEKPAIAGGASIGAHYRHCLDHFSALLSEDTAGFIDYDARKRDPRIENERGVALEMTHRLQDLAASMDSTILRSPVSVRCGVSYCEKEAPVVTSSVEREVMFSISHAVHHYALIAMICRTQEITVPDGFGVAPSTLHYRNESELSRS